MFLFKCNSRHVFLHWLTGRHCWSSQTEFAALLVLQSLCRAAHEEWALEAWSSHVCLEKSGIQLDASLWPWLGSLLVVFLTRVSHFLQNCIVLSHLLSCHHRTTCSSWRILIGNLEYCSEYAKRYRIHWSVAKSKSMIATQDVHVPVRVKAGQSVKAQVAPIWQLDHRLESESGPETCFLVCGAEKEIKRVLQITEWNLPWVILLWLQHDRGATARKWSFCKPAARCQAEKESSTPYILHTFMLHRYAMLSVLCWLWLTPQSSIASLASML